MSFLDVLLLEPYSVNVWIAASGRLRRRQRALPQMGPGHRSGEHAPRAAGISEARRYGQPGLSAGPPDDFLGLERPPSDIGRESKMRY